MARSALVWGGLGLGVLSLFALSGSGPSGSEDYGFDGEELDWNDYLPDPNDRTPVVPGDVVDITADSANVTYKRGSVAGVLKRKRKRDMSKVVGITLHNWGVKNVGRSAHRKGSYHLSIHNDGTVYLVHPFNTYLYHGHGLNRSTIGISLGHMPSRGESLTPQQRAGLRKALSYAVAEIRRQGGRADFLYAHRQSSEDRGADPGAAVWTEAVSYGRGLGLATEPERTWGTGQAIPAGWRAVA